MLENTCVEMRDIHDGEHRYGTNDDRVEEKLVFINLKCGQSLVSFLILKSYTLVWFTHIVEKWEPVFCLVGIKPKHAPPDALEFPSRYQDQPGHFREYGSSGSKDKVAIPRVLRVATIPKVSVPSTVNYDDERR